MMIKPLWLTGHVMVCLILFCGFLNIAAYKAVVIVPVADLLGEYAQEGESAYRHIPVGGGKGPITNTCRREHQLLYNDIVDVLEEKNEQVRVDIPGLIIGFPKKPIEEQSTFWMLKKNLYPLLIDKDEKLLSQLPELISYQRLMPQQLNTIVLILPYHDVDSSVTYSAGTRFVVESVNDEQKIVSVYRLELKAHHCTTMIVPKENCLFPVAGKELQRRKFVELIQFWTHNPQGVSPYIWGGGSLIFSSQDLNFKEIEAENGCSYYAIQNADGLFELKDVKTGFDCSGLILRAAQATGLPYFYRNSSALALYLACLLPDEQVQNGDLIWIPGHVMMVSDCERNLVVEARGYSSGWGCLHEIPLKDLFKGVETYADLEKHFKEQQPLSILDKAGNVARTYDTFKLLALDSVWDQMELDAQA